MSEDKIKPYRHHSDRMRKVDQDHLDAARRALIQADANARDAEKRYGPNSYPAYDAKRSVKIQRKAVQDLEQLIATSENVEP